MIWNDNLANQEYITKIMDHPRSIGSQLSLFQRESGCVAPTAHGAATIHINILVVAADAPAAAFIAARNASFSKAKCMCRGCDAGQADRLTHVPFLLRCLKQIRIKVPQEYEPSLESGKHCTLLTKEIDQEQRVTLQSKINNGGASAYMTATGLKKVRHLLYWCPHAAIWSACVQDGMHVLLEGVVKYLLYLTFHWFVNTLKVPLTTINYMIQNHQYLPFEMPVPAEIRQTHMEGKPSTGGKIKQTAGMVLTLSRNFIAIFGPMAWSHNWQQDRKWQCMELLLVILFAMLDVEFSVPQLMHIEQQIGQFYTLFREAWGPDLATPKFHYLGHIPWEIFLYGPMRYLWCMRFEAKHQW
jgi:hypothetical protein